MEDLRKYNPEGSILREAQHRMVHILEEIDKVCRKNHIDYFLDGGSLLGAVRHGGFIPWDDDLDITVMAKDYRRMRECLVRELPEDLVFQDVTTEPNLPLCFGKVRDKNSYFEEEYTGNIKEKGIYVDIFPKEYILSFAWKKKLDYWYGHCFRAMHNYTCGRFDKLKSFIFFPFAWICVWGTRLVTKLFPTSMIGNIYGWWSYKPLYEKDIFPVKDIKFENITVLGPADPDAMLKAYFGDYMQIPPKEKRPQHAGKIEIYK